MIARPIRRTFAAVTAMALAGLGLGVAASSANAIDSLPSVDATFGGTFYLLNGETGDDFTEGSDAMSWYPVGGVYSTVTVPTPGDLTTSNIPAVPSDAAILTAFVSAQGQEANPQQWKAYADQSATTPYLVNVTPGNFIVAGTSTTDAVAKTTGDYSLGYAWTKMVNGAQTVVSGGVYFVHIHVNGNANTDLTTFTYERVQAPQSGPVGTTTTLQAPATGHEGLPVSLVADVTADDSSTAAGQLTITGQRGTDPSEVLGTVSGTHLAIAPTSLTAGTWTITASFDSTDDDAYVDSTSTVKTVEVTVLTAEPDYQNVTVDIPEGVLTITTPYTAAAPLALGVADFDEVNSTFSASATFGSSSDIAKAIKILDRRPGDLGFTASVASSDFTTGGADPDDETIKAEKGALQDVTAVQVPLNALQASDVTPSDVDSLSATAQTIANYPAGKQIGAAWLYGTFALTDVPSSIVGGLYTATLTFTVE